MEKIGRTYTVHKIRKLKIEGWEEKKIDLDMKIDSCSIGIEALRGMKKSTKNVTLGLICRKKPANKVSMGMNNK